tara:strand:- start:26 stop:502 length:477 start_codon:yes stop_codon:yes gene_type:complete
MLNISTPLMPTNVFSGMKYDNPQSKYFLYCLIWENGWVKVGRSERLLQRLASYATPPANGAIYLSHLVGYKEKHTCDRAECLIINEVSSVDYSIKSRSEWFLFGSFEMAMATMENIFVPEPRFPVLLHDFLDIDEPCAFETSFYSSLNNPYHQQPTTK